MNNDITLYEATENVLAIMDTLPMVEDENERKELEASLAHAISEEVRKVDGFAAHLKKLDSAVAFLKAREAELADRRKMLVNRSDRLKRYAVTVIENMPRRETKAGTRYARLEGREYSLGLRAGRARVSVTDEQAVPSQYKDVTVKMPLETWQEIEGELGVYGSQQDFEAWKAVLNSVKADITVRLTDVHAALDAGEDVPGAEIVYGDPTVEVK